MKIFEITRKNIEHFSDTLVKFRKDCSYNSICFSMADIAREVNSEAIVDNLLETMNLQGFGVNKIKAFINNNYIIDDLVAPEKSDPVLYFTNSMLENYMVHYQKDLSFFCKTAPQNVQCYNF